MQILNLLRILFIVVVNKGEEIVGDEEEEVEGKERNKT